MHTPKYVWLHTFIFTCIHKHSYIHTWTYTFMHVCLCIRMSTCIQHGCMSAYIYRCSSMSFYIYTYLHTSMHAYNHTYLATHIYMHTYIHTLDIHACCLHTNISTCIQHTYIYVYRLMDLCSCTQTYIHTDTHACMSIYTYIFLLDMLPHTHACLIGHMYRYTSCMYAYIQTYLHAYNINVCLHSCIYVCIPAYRLMDVCACIHSYMHVLHRGVFWDNKSLLFMLWVPILQ